MSYTYDKQPKDVKFRVVNLKSWNRENKWMDFTAQHMENGSRYSLLEILHEDGTTELRQTGDAKEKVYWSLNAEGQLKIIFQSEQAIHEGGPFLGHLFLILPGKSGIRYNFPRVPAVKEGNKLIYTARIGKSPLMPSLQIAGDEYFNQLFVLERNN